MVERTKRERATRHTARSDCRRDESDAIRRAYFAHLSQRGSVAMRFGVSVERILDHLRGRVGSARGRLLIDPVEIEIADLAHVVACVDGRPGAWSLLAERHERALVSAAEPPLGSADAVLAARQLLRAAREQSAQPASGPVDLRRYSGARPLRQWLLDRLAQRIEADRRPEMRRAAGSEAAFSARLRLALQLLERSRRSIASGAVEQETGVDQPKSVDDQRRGA